MIELLVAGLCAGNFQCGQATKAYLSLKTPAAVLVRQRLENAQRVTAAIIGENTLIGVSTLAAVTAHKTYQVRIGKYFSIGRFETDFEGRKVVGDRIIFGFSF